MKRGRERRGYAWTVQPRLWHARRHPATALPGAGEVSSSTDAGGKPTTAGSGATPFSEPLLLAMNPAAALSLGGFGSRPPKYNGSACFSAKPEPARETVQTLSSRSVPSKARRLRGSVCRATKGSSGPTAASQRGPRRYLTEGIPAVY